MAHIAVKIIGLSELHYQPSKLPIQISNQITISQRGRVVMACDSSESLSSSEDALFKRFLIGQPAWVRVPPLTLFFLKIAPAGGSSVRDFTFW